MLASVDSAPRPQNNWLRLLLLALLLAAFGLRLQELTRQDIWWDEARNIDVALRPFLQVATAPELDIQPPVYYWLLHGWNRALGIVAGQPASQIVFAGRLLSVFFGVLGVALLHTLGRRGGGPLAGVIAALVGAAAPFWLAESQETRMYTVGFALLAGAAVMFLGRDWRLETSDPRSPISDLQSPVSGLQSLFFVLLSAAALLTHYNAVFVLVAWYLWWGVWALLRPNRWRQLRTLVLCGLGMTLLVLPVTPIALRQIPGYANPNITIPSVGDYLWQNWQAYIGGYAFDPGLLAGSSTLWLWLVLAIVALGLVLACFAAVRTQKSARPHLAARDESPFTIHDSRFTIHNSPFSRLAVLTFLSTWLLGGLALYYIAVLDRNAFNVRYASFVTPALYTLGGIGLAAYRYWWKPLPVAAAAIVLVGLVPALQADLYDSRFDREHIGEVTDWLRANTAPGDVIFVDQKYPFGFYYQPYTVAQDAASPVGDTPPARYLFVDINTIDRRLDEWGADARRVFWVQWFESDTDPRRAVHFLLGKVGQHAGEQAFQGYSIDWWEMNPPTSFELAPDLTPTHIAFPPAVEAVAVSLPNQPLQPGDPLPVAIRWQRTPGGAVDRPLKARVALYDAADARLAQADERLLNDRHRAPSHWEPTDQPLNVYLLELPEELPSGDYAVRLLVYDAETLEPLSTVNAAGNPAGQEARLGTVRIGEREQN